MITVLFVCLGNICRSPMAEAVFQALVDDAGLSRQIRVDSAGTGAWHVGESAHPGTRRILAEHGIKYSGSARQVRSADLADRSAYIVAMDGDNMADLRRRFGSHPKLYRLLDFADQTSERDVPDPYYTGGFDYVYRLVEDGCAGLLETIRQSEGL